MLVSVQYWPDTSSGLWGFIINKPPCVQQNIGHLSSPRLLSVCFVSLLLFVVEGGLLLFLSLSLSFTLCLSLCLSVSVSLPPSFLSRPFTLLIFYISASLGVFPSLSFCLCLQISVCLCLSVRLSLIKDDEQDKSSSLQDLMIKKQPLISTKLW